MNIMAGVNNLVALVVVLIAKDGALSCSLSVHKCGLSLSSSTDSISHHTSALCGLSTDLNGVSNDTKSTLISSSPSINSDVLHPSPNEPDLALPSKLTSPVKVTSPPAPAPDPTLTPSETSNINSDLVKLLFKLLSSISSSTTLPVSQWSPSSSIPYSPTSSFTPEFISTLNPSLISTLCAIFSSNSSAENVLTNLPCGSVLPFKLLSVTSSSVPKQAISSDQTLFKYSDLNSALIKLLFKLLVSASTPNASSAAQTPFAPSWNSPAPIISKATPVLSPVTPLYPSSPDSNLYLPSLFPKLPCSSSSASKLTPVPVTSSPVSALDSSTTSFKSSSLNPYFINYLYNLLAYASTSTTSTHSQIPLTPSSIPSSSVISTPIFATVSKPYTAFSPCLSSSGSKSDSSSVPSNLPCGPVSPLIKNPAESLHLPYQVPVLKSTSSSTSGLNTDVINLLLKLSLVVPASTTLPVSKVPPSSPLRPPIKLTTPLPIPTLKPNVISSLCDPSSGSNSGFSSKLPSPPCILIPSPKLTSSQVISTKPLITPTPVSSKFPSQNSTTLNHVLKMLLSTSAPTVSTASVTSSLSTPSPLLPHFTTAPILVLKSHTLSSPSCTSSTGPNYSSSIVTQSSKNTQDVSTPSAIPSALLSTSSVSFGYNPDFMKLLLKHFLSDPASIPPTLLTSFQPPQIVINTTPKIVSSMNEYSTTVSHESSSALSSGTLSTLEILPSGLVTTPTPVLNMTTLNVSSSSNQTLYKFLIQHLLSTQKPTSLKNPPSQQLPSSSSTIISTPNTTPDLNLTHNSSSTFVPTSQPVNSVYGLFNKYPKLASGSLLFSPSLPTSTTPTPYLETTQNNILSIDLNSNPTSTPCGLMSHHKPCHLKHSGLSHLSGSTPSSLSPCLQKILHPHTSHSLSPCSHSVSKLLTDYKLHS